MPLYEYRCKNCHHQFERIQKFSDDPVRICPECGQQAVEQLLSAPAVQFKGSGWYVTDYARKGAPGASSESGAGKGNGSSSTSSSASDSKPSASADSKPASPAKEANS